MTSIGRYSRIATVRADRLLTIVLLLQRRGRQRVTDLAERLEVSERTILRDMESLSAAGIPVTSVRGPGGGFELVHGFRTDLSTLSEEECAAIVLLGLPGAAEGMGQGQEASNLRLKFDLLITDRGRQASRRTSQQFFHDEPPILPALQRKLTFLRESIARQRVVRLSVGEENARKVVEPLGLVLQRGDWFLVAGTEHGTQPFGVDSLSTLSNTGARFERPEPFDLAATWRTNQARMGLS